MPGPPESPHLLIVGDSASLGAAEVRGNDIVSYISPSYVDLIRARFPTLQIDIDAEVHRTTVRVRENLDAILAAHPTRHVLLAIAANDADVDWRRFVLSDGAVVRNRIPVDRYENNLRVIVEKLQSLGIATILIDMHNHYFKLRGPYISALAGKDVTAMIERHGGQSESDKRLQIYRKAVGSVAADMNVPLAGYGAALDGVDPTTYLMPDGAHLGTEGHRVLASLLEPILSKMFGDAPAR